MALTSYPGTFMTTGAVNTKGSYVEIVAATPYASSRLHLGIRSAGAARKPYLIDVATGAAGAESVVVANLAVVSDADFLVAAWVALDMDVPAGTRLAARAQSITASQSVSCAVLLEDRALASLAAPVTYGAFANSIGAVVDPGGTANTKGSYVQLSASTASRLDALVLCLTVTLDGQTLASFTTWQVDVATGAAGAETVVVADVIVNGSLNADAPRPAIIRLPIVIAAGSRLAVRCACDRNTAFERRLAITAIGLQEPAAAGGGEHAYTFVG